MSANFPDLRWDREFGFKDGPAPLRVVPGTEAIECMTVP